MNIADYLSGFPAFIAHFILALGYLVAYLAIYTAVTRHDEWALLKRGNVAAAIALGGSVLGFSLPLAASVEYSVSIVDNSLWAMVSMVVQIGVYLLIKLAVRDLNKRIEDGEIAIALIFAAFSISAGQLAAASMTT
jgi:putative membrane protein